MTDSVQIGDMGIGFSKVSYDGEIHYSENPPHSHMVKGNHRFIRGNHDNPDVCSRHSQWIKDGTCETTAKGTKIMYVGGAWSIDRQWRTEGRDWWADEELSIKELYNFLDVYSEFRPEVMVTHDFPQSVAYQLFLEGTHKPVLPTRTGQALNEMLNIHQPKLWLAGHWHEHRNQVIDNCRFVCLAELQDANIDI